MRELVEQEFDLEDIVKASSEDLLKDTRDHTADDIGKRATNFARYAMADVEYALAVLGTAMSKKEYARVFKAMMIRKAKNELRKYNANQQY